MVSPQIKAESHYVDVNGQRLHYKKWPENGPPLIFLHGVTSSSNGWNFVAPHFIDNYSVMAFDFRGHGLSSKPDGGYTWVDHYAADISEFVNAHIHEPCILVGHSLGAMVTVPVAVSAPDKIRAIVMEDPPAFPGPGGRNVFDPILALKRLPYDERVKSLVEKSGLNQTAAERRATELEQMHEQVLVELIAGTTGYDTQEWFPRVDCPSLVILGNPDRGGVTIQEKRPLFKQLLKGTKIVEWDDVGHLIHFQQFDRFVAEVKSFLKSIE